MKTTEPLVTNRWPTWLIVLVSRKQQVKTRGKSFEIVVANSTNFKDVKEEVKKLSEKTKLWYRIENTETESNCITF